MAIVKCPALSLEASGNLGAICYSRWRDRQIARGAWTGVVPNTSAQVAIQGHMSAAATAWGTYLTSAQRTAWEIYAKNVIWADRLGDKHSPSGYNCFISYSIQRQRWGLAILFDPPSTHRSEFPSSYSVWSDVPGNLHADLAYPVLNPGCDGVEYWVAGPYDSPGRRAIEPEYRFELVRLVPQASGAQWVQTPYNKWYWVKARFIWLPGYTGNYWYEQHYHTVGV